MVEKRSPVETMAAVFPAGYDRLFDESCRDAAGTDVRIVTSGGKIILAHSSILASVSPVLEKILMARPRKRGSGEKVIPIPGVPCKAVAAFIRCLYTSRSLEEEELGKHGVHILVLSHVMMVGWLKRATTVGLGATLTVENVVDMLQLARQCDAPRLYMRCMNLLRKEFKQVEQTEGWRFVQENDPCLELEILQFLEETEKREKRRMRIKKEQEVYMELSQAMECLHHICTEGCTAVGPREGNSQPVARSPEKQQRGPCSYGSTCEGLQQLIRHFASCEKKKLRVPGGGCGRCTRMWQLLRLHSSVCDQSDTSSCKVPLCKQFKERMTMGKKGDEGRWAVLAKKVASAKVISTLSKRKREEEHHKHWIAHV